jgi:hypothetical protein
VSDQIDAFKAGADRYAQYYGDVRRLLTTEFAAETRWITASLFAVNAGGLASIASKTTLGTSDKFAGVSFWLGIMLAFCFVVYSQFKTKSFLRTIQHMEECWVIAASTGILDDARLTKLENEKKQTNTKGSIYFSISSFVMFSVGIFLLALQL